MHSHKHHRAGSAGHRRAKQFLHENHGGHVPHKKFGGATGMRGKPARGNDSESEMMAEGAKPKRRRGGKIGKPMKVQVNNIHVHPHPPLGAPDAAGMMAGPPPGAVPPQGMPPGLPQGLPPGAPGMPMRARGGHVSHHDYYDPREDISEYRQAHAAGGHVLAGAATGVGRRQAFHDQKKREH